jgi:alanine dehydrogenase
VDRAAIIAVDSIQQANIESGDLIQAFGDDNSRWQQVRELCEIVAGKRPGRKSPEQITLFKSNGIASWDLAVAAYIFECAEKKGLGSKIEFGGGHR